MGESSGSDAARTVAHGRLEDLITPRLEPGTACLVVIRGRSVGLMLELQKLPAVIGRSPDVELRIDDLAVSRKHAQIERGPDGFLVRDLRSTNGVFVNGLRVETRTLRDGDRIQIGTSVILKFCFQDDLETDLQKKLYDSATRDSLTGLYNRSFFLETLEVDFDHALKAEHVMTLLLLDLDHFKVVNDTYGHRVGDLVLAQFARVIQAALRAEDLAARYGGEEFAVLLRHTDGARAFTIAERLRKTIAGHVFEFEGGSLRLTVSIGLATLEAESHASAAQLIDAADKLLYKAKQQGRNRTAFVGFGATDRLMAKTVILAIEEALGASPEPEAPDEAAGAAVSEPGPKKANGRARGAARRISPPATKPPRKR
jgi:two-component system, cell cycle response regulator